MSEQHEERGPRVVPLLHERIKTRISEHEEAFWGEVRVVHAHWRQRQPHLKLGQAAIILLRYGVRHAEEAWHEALEACKEEEGAIDTGG